jgi:hypothetical protein
MAALSSIPVLPKAAALGVLTAHCDGHSRDTLRPLHVDIVEKLGI